MVSGSPEGPNPPATAKMTEVAEATCSAGEVDVAVGPWEVPNPPANSWMTEAGPWEVPNPPANSWMTEAGNGDAG